MKVDFPRIPFTASRSLFRALAKLGGELVAIHLMEGELPKRLQQKLPSFDGPVGSVVEKVSFSNDCVWIDKKKTRAFRGVPESVWSFEVGGYRVCHKWLDDRRKTGRGLSSEDIAHYERVVAVLAETQRFMKEIDAEIAEHGGWPGAFATKASAS